MDTKESVVLIDVEPQPSAALRAWWDTWVTQNSEQRLALSSRLQKAFGSEPSLPSVQQHVDDDR